MNPTDEIRQFINENTDPKLSMEQRIRDALNVALARLREAQDRANDLERRMAIMTTLTQDMKQRYIDSGGNSCLFCGSKDIVGGHIEVEGNGAFQEVTCNHCHKRWNDIHQLVDVEEVE